jgi:hypothetical protein
MLSIRSTLSIRVAVAPPSDLLRTYERAYFVLRAMRTLFLGLVSVSLLGCSGEDLSQRQLLASDTPKDRSQVFYPPRTIPEKTFILSTPITYETKRVATPLDSAAALRAVNRLGSLPNSQYLAVPVAAHRGQMASSDVMIYAPQSQALIRDTVYELAYTPASGQVLQLDGFTVIFESPGR